MKETVWTSLIRDISGDLNRLNSVWRYSSIPVTGKENDVEHQGWVCIYSLMIHNCLRPLDVDLSGPIATHAISHDIVECVTGDIVRTFKYSDLGLKNAIKTAEINILKNLPDSVQLLINCHTRQLALMNKSHELDYVETVVKMGDFLSLWNFMKRELLRSNREIVPYVKMMVDDLECMSRNFLSGQSAVRVQDPSLLASIGQFYRELANEAGFLKNRLTFVPRY